MAVIIEKPNVDIKQQFETSPDRTSSLLPTILLAERYNVQENVELGQYDGNATAPVQFAYPNIASFSVVDQDYATLKADNAKLVYYASLDEGSTWRKIANTPNQVRTLLANNLIFADDPDGLFPKSAVFKERGVKVGDAVRVSAGGSSIITEVKRILPDRSVPSIGSASASQANQTAQSNSIANPVAAGGNSGNTLLASNTGGTYLGDLFNNVLEDTYSVRVLQAGTKPNNAVTANNTVSSLVVEVNEIYDFSASEIYTIEVITGGALETATVRVVSASGLDDQAEYTTPAISTFIALGSRGLEYRFSGSGTLTAGETFVVSATPSQARFEITTDSGRDQITNRVFPGFDYEFDAGADGLKLTFSEGTSDVLNVGDSWSTAVTKEVDAVVAVSQGDFTGTKDTNYLVEVLQGGEFGVAAIRVTSTATGGNQVIQIDGAGTGNAVELGDGVELYFTANAQNGLVRGDLFIVNAIASAETAFRKLELRDSLPVEAQQCTIAAAIYTGSNGSPNTGASSGTFVSANNALDLNANEVYTISVSTNGAYGTAELTWTSSSGLDDAAAPVVIPVTPGDPIAIGTQGLILTFSGANTFELTDSWTISVSKVNLEVELMIQESTINIPRERQDDLSLIAWEPEEDQVTVNEQICLLVPEWDAVDCLPLFSGTLKLTYRALHTLGSEEVITISTQDSDVIEAALGIDHVDNPAARGMRFAISNSASETVKIVYPRSADLAGWESMLAKLEVRNESQVYRIGVLSSNEQFIEAAIAHAEKTSDKNKWRVVYGSREIPEVFDIIGTPDDSNFTATIEADPSAPTEFTILKTTDANFNLARIGDFVRYLGKEFRVQEILTTTEIKLDASFGTAQNIPAEVYIYRQPSSTELAERVASIGRGYANRRMHHLVPDEFTGFGEKHPGYYFVAALTGRLASEVPHQPVTNFTLNNVDQVEKVLFTFTDSDLDIMANGGNMIIAQDSIDEAPYIRHQLSTNVADLKFRERSITENYDSVSYGVKRIAAPFIGRYNIHPGVLEQFRTNLEGYLFALTADTTQTAGPQVLDYEILRIEQSETAEDTLIVELGITFPAPLNYIKMTITI